MRTPLVLTILAAPAIAAAQPAVPVQQPPPEPAPWTFGVAGRAGLDVPTSKLGLMAALTLELDVALPVMDHRFGLALGVGWTRPGHDGAVMDPRVGGDQTYEVDQTEVTIALDATLRLLSGDRALSPWIGAGPVVTLLETKETTTIAPGANTEQSTKLGFELAVGADWKAGPGYVVGELRAMYAGLDHHLTGDSNAGNVTVGVGYRLVF